MRRHSFLYSVNIYRFSWLTFLTLGASFKLHIKNRDIQFNTSLSLWKKIKQSLSLNNMCYNLGVRQREKLLAFLLFFVFVFENWMLVGVLVKKCTNKRKNTCFILFFVDAIFVVRIIVFSQVPHEYNMYCKISKITVTWYTWTKLFLRIFFKGDPSRNIKNYYIILEVIKNVTYYLYGIFSFIVITMSTRVCLSS